MYQVSRRQLCLAAGLAGAAPAHAQTCVLRYYWNADGSPTWNSEQITDPWFGDGPPAITRSPGGTEIAVAGREVGFRFLWNTDGSPTWSSVQIDAPAVAWGPVMTRYDGGTEIATVEKS